MPTARALVAGMPDPLTVEQFQIAKRSRLIAAGAPPICPWCDSALSLRADVNPERRMHFLHPSGTRCPTIGTGGARYEELASVPIDPVERDQRLLDVAEHIEDVYRRCLSLALGLSSEEFTATVEEATARDVWSFRNLPHTLIPMVLLLCHVSCAGTAIEGRRSSSCSAARIVPRKISGSVPVTDRLASCASIRNGTQWTQMSSPITAPSARRPVWLDGLEGWLRGRVR
jgi:hypothetical protein